MTRLPMLRLAAALMLSTTPALAFDPATMSETERAAFGAAVRDYLMENPEVLVEAINVLEARNVEASAETDRALVAANRVALFESEGSWVGGNPDGDLTVVEFIDYRCGVCRQFAAEIMEAVEEDGNTRLILKEFPILGQESEMASRFAISVLQLEGDAAYLAAHDALMEMRGAVTADSLSRLATQIGATPEAILNHMNTDPVTEVLRHNRQLAERMAIQGTPTFVIGDQMLRGMPRAGLGDAIATIREAG